MTTELVVPAVDVAMPAVTIEESVWRDVVAVLTSARSATLICHVAPDGDALGSMLALAKALNRRGVEVTCSWGDSAWKRPRGFDWLPGIASTVPPSEVPDQTDAMVVLDTGAVDRLGVLASRLAGAGKVVVIDHHAHGSDIQALRCVDPTAAATAAVVEELLRRIGCEIDAEMATCLYAGVVTDTGSFAHPVTTPGVHHLAARLIAAGARPDLITKQIWGTRPPGIIAMLGAALSRASFDRSALNGRGLIWTWVTAAELAAGGLDLDDADAVMEDIRTAAGADVAVVLKQAASSTYKASTRSRGQSDVGAACAALGGGGHRLAAGFTASGELAGLTPAAIVERFARLVPDSSPP